MKALHVYDTIDRPEAEIVRGLSERGVDVSVFCKPDALNKPLVEGYAKEVLPLTCSSKLDMNAVRTLRSYLRQQPVDIIHAFTGRTVAVSLIASSGIKPSPKVIAYRGAVGNVKWYDPTSWLSFLHPRVSKIICVSKAVYEDLKKSGASKEKLLQLYKGHRVEWYDTLPGISRSDFSIPETDVVIGCVANMRRTKGADNLLRAVAKLPSLENVSVLLVGEVRDDEIYRLAEQEPLKGKVHFAGFRKDAFLCPKLFDVFVMPSRDREGLPKGVIEAMAQSVPVVVTNVGGMPELVREGIDGFVVKDGDIQQMTSAIAKLLESEELRKSCGASARQRISTDFCVDTSIEKTQSTYSELAA